jgi:hypothetical protein
MMLGMDGVRSGTPSRARRSVTPRPEGLLFAMASPLRSASDEFRWPSWLSPIRASWDSPLRTPSSPPAHRRSL